MGGYFYAKRIPGDNLEDFAEHQFQELDRQAREDDEEKGELRKQVKDLLSRIKVLEQSSGGAGYARTKFEDKGLRQGENFVELLTMPEDSEISNDDYFVVKLRTVNNSNDTEIQGMLTFSFSGEVWLGRSSVTQANAGTYDQALDIIYGLGAGSGAGNSRNAEIYGMEDRKLVYNGSSAGTAFYDVKYGEMFHWKN